MQPLSTFPPTFQGNPYSYGAALFATTLIVALCIAQLCAYLFEQRRNDQIDQLLGNMVRNPRTAQFDALQTYRSIIICFLIAIILRALPDALLLFFWGEASDKTMVILFAIDRYFDTIALAPVLTALALVTWVAQAIPQQLIKIAQVPLSRPTWDQFKQKTRIVAMVLFLATGVTLAKAGVG